VGIEPTHKGFADLSLTTWVPRLNLTSITKLLDPCQCCRVQFYSIDGVWVKLKCCGLPGRKSRVQHRPVGHS
jgi:hypothetical protein